MESGWNDLCRNIVCTWVFKQFLNTCLVGSIYGRSSINSAHLFLIGWFLKKSSPLKPLGQIKQTFTGNIYRRSSIKLPHFILIGWKTLSPWAILVFDWLKFRKIFFYETWKVLNKDCSLGSDPLNMATTGHSWFWLVVF